MKKYLVTGINSGLGLHLFNNLEDCYGLNRNNFNIIKKKSYDTIIHCAFNRNNNLYTLYDHYNYLNDNIFLTKNLLTLNYNNFIYISSVDAGDVKNMNLYSQFKRFAESVVIRNRNVSIIRLPSLLGDTMKSNSLTKMMTDKNVKLSLSGESEFNYVKYSDFRYYIKNYKCKNVMLYYVANKNIKLKDIKKEFNLDVKFGDYVYNTKIEHDFSEFTGKTSMETIKEYFV